MAQEIGVTSAIAGLERYQGFDERDRQAVTSDNPGRLFPRLSSAKRPEPALGA